MSQRSMHLRKGNAETTGEENVDNDKKNVGTTSSYRSTYQVFQALMYFEEGDIKIGCDA